MGPYMIYSIYIIFNHIQAVYDMFHPTSSHSSQSRFGCQDGSDSQHGTAVRFFEGSFLSAMSASSDPNDRTEGRKLLLLWLHEKARKCGGRRRFFCFGGGDVDAYKWWQLQIFFLEFSTRKLGKVSNLTNVFRSATN